MLIVDLTGAVQSANAAAIDMFGARDADELLGARWPMLLAESDRPAAETALRAASEGESGRLVASTPTPANQPLRLEMIASPLRDASGSPDTVLVTLHNISELEAARLAAEARERLAIQDASVLQSVVERAYLINWTLDYARNVIVIATSNASEGSELEMSLEDALARYRPEDQARMLTLLERSRLYGESFKFDARFTEANGGRGWVRLYGEPIYQSGECVGLRGAAIDISEEVAARDKIEGAQTRLRLVAQLAGVEVFEIDFEQRLLIEEGSLASILGSPLWHDLWSDPFRRVDPRDRERVEQQWTEAQEKGVPFRSEYRIRRSDGEVAWIFAVGEFMGGDGRPLRLIGGIADITERKLNEIQLLQTLAEMREHEARQKLLLDELNHRVKNTLASVQSLAMQTLTGARNPQDGRDLFIERLLALSATHDLLVKRAWVSASFRELVESVLKLYGQAYSYEGADLHLDPNFAVSLGMALHELATNALKHGAWRTGGRVTITAAADETRASITWQEHGGPPVSPPTRRGFGTRLLQRGVSGELGGKLELVFAPDGLICRIQAPLNARLQLVDA